jgi:hypothetical protein
LIFAEQYLKLNNFGPSSLKPTSSRHMQPTQPVCIFLLAYKDLVIFKNIAANPILTAVSGPKQSIGLFERGIRKLSWKLLS